MFGFVNDKTKIYSLKNPYINSIGNCKRKCLFQTEKSVKQYFNNYIKNTLQSDCRISTVCNFLLNRENAQIMPIIRLKTILLTLQNFKN